MVAVSCVVVPLQLWSIVFAFAEKRLHSESVSVAEAVEINEAVSRHLMVSEVQKHVPCVHNGGVGHGTGFEASLDVGADDGEVRVGQPSLYDGREEFERAVPVHTVYAGQFVQVEHGCQSCGCSYRDESQGGWASGLSLKIDCFRAEGENAKVVDVPDEALSDAVPISARVDHEEETVLRRGESVCKPCLDCQLLVGEKDFTEHAARLQSSVLVGGNECVLPEPAPHPRHGGGVPPTRHAGATWKFRRSE